MIRSKGDGIHTVKRRIRIILPVATNQCNAGTKLELAEVASPDTRLEISSLSHGPAAVESEYEAALVAPLVVEEVSKAQGQGLAGAG